MHIGVPNNETAAMLVSQTNPVRVELCLCVQRFLYVPINLHMQMLAT